VKREAEIVHGVDEDVDGDAGVARGASGGTEAARGAGGDVKVVHDTSGGVGASCGVGRDVRDARGAG
jgi:hypothetical protein